MVVDYDSTYISREAGLNELIRASVTMIICAYLPDTITMVSLLHDRDTGIDSEISVISFNDTAVFRLLIPQVAVISRQAKDMDRQGTDMLFDMTVSNDCSHGESCHTPSLSVLCDLVRASM